MDRLEVQRALAQLIKEGYARQAGTDEQGRPVYEITPAGAEAMDDHEFDNPKDR